MSYFKWLMIKECLHIRHTHTHWFLEINSNKLWVMTNKNQFASAQNEWNFACCVPLHCVHNTKNRFSCVWQLIWRCIFVKSLFLLASTLLQTGTVFLFYVCLYIAHRYSILYLYDSLSMCLLLMYLLLLLCVLCTLIQPYD